MQRICHQINLQSSFGGGEVYTRLFTSTLADLGWRTRLIVSARARFWHEMRVTGATLIPVAKESEVISALGGGSDPVVTHTALSPMAARQVAANHPLGGFIHMPLYERDPRGLREYHRLFAVSRHVLTSACERGHKNVHPAPIYAVADLSPRANPAEPNLRRRSVFDWDKRKFRDRMLGYVEPLAESFRSRHAFSRRTGLTLGIVSRLTPIKQFPLMFRLLAPRLMQVPGVNLEVFGAGGYATVRDLRRALEPLGARVRFWGHQTDVHAVYRQLDWVLSGLPEKEALGLNLIEAQLAGTPVLAVDAPPFDETVEHGRSGYRFVDPRRDNGADFGGLIGQLVSGALPRPDPRRASSHLEKFSPAAYRSRVADAMSALESA